MRLEKLKRAYKAACDLSLRLVVPREDISQIIHPVPTKPAPKQIVAKTVNNGPRMSSDLLGGIAAVLGVFAAGFALLAWKAASKEAKESSVALEKYKADAGKLIAAADSRAAQANAEAEKAKLALGLVSAENGPRSSKLAGSNFKELLSKIPPGEADVLYKPEDEEAYSFASTILYQLALAHWKVTTAMPISSELKRPIPVLKMDASQFDWFADTLPATVRVGAGSLSVHLWTLNPNELKDNPGLLLSEAFLKAGFPVQRTLRADMPKNKVLIIVGQRSPAVLSFPTPPLSP